MLVRIHWIRKIKCLRRQRNNQACKLSPDRIKQRKRKIYIINRDVFCLQGKHHPPKSNHMHPLSLVYKSSKMIYKKKKKKIGKKKKERKIGRAILIPL